MKPVGLVIVALLVLCGCATTSVSPLREASPEETALETRRAVHYLTVLREKKNRFWESQGIDQDYVPEGENPAAAASSKLAMAYRAASQCDRIALSDWGSSVLYGQSFLGYENYVNTVTRCYAQ